MGRRPRAAAQAAAASIKPAPTPPVAETWDEEMVDAPASGASTPAAERDTPAATSAEPPSAPSTPAPAPVEPPRKRRLPGRPPKNRPPEWADAAESTPHHGSDSGTPFRRRRGRPAMGGGRWGKIKGGPSHVTQVPIDKEGNMMDVIDDEVALPEDVEGETKVDKSGYLQGGRDYRCRTFEIQGRKGRLYMLSTEPARCIGFRDSYLFFQKHKQLYKIIIDEPAKRDLIDREVIPHSYKGRAIGVVTARSVFREFGARIVVGGRKVIDDYQAEAARRNGDIEGELADPYDVLPKAGEPYNKNQYVAWHGASSVYHSNAPSMPAPTGKGGEAKKRKVVVNDVNWMLEHAREASQYNSFLAASRRFNFNGVYDPHTNIVQYPKITQPTHVRWERGALKASIADRATDADTAAKVESLLSNGVSRDGSPPDEKPCEKPSPDSTAFAAPPSPYTRNYLIVDTYFATPPISGLGVPGPDGDGFDVGINGLGDVSADVLAELPPECAVAFAEAKEQETAWKGRWYTEAVDSARGKLRIGF